MKIPLNEIKPSPNPIRKTWDEEKMNELATSLVEEGQVEPIGVRTNGKDGEYVIVWGHRRAEAARRCGWDEIDCVIVPNDELNNLIQAGIENLCNEDMSADDKADWVQRLIELGLNDYEISRRTTIPRTTIQSWIIFRRERAQGLDIDVQMDSRDDGIGKIRQVASVLGNDLQAKKAVLQKTSDDKLNRDQTRAVAEAYRDAPNAEIKAAVLKSPIISRDTSADILRRSTARVELDTGHKVIQEMNDWQKEKEERQSVDNYDLAVKSFIDAMRLFKQEAQRVPSHVKYDKYSPEAARYVSRKISQLIDDLKTNIELLDGVE